MEFLISINGISFWREDLKLEAELQVMSDASRLVGFGVFFCGQWCAEEWPQDWLYSGILRGLTFLEFIPVLVAVQIWGRMFVNHTVHFWMDNVMVVLHIVNSLNSKSAWVMFLIHEFTLLCLHLNILFFARHVPGVSNRVGDALSR